jgi:hypothetical protein
VNKGGFYMKFELKQSDYSFLEKYAPEEIEMTSVKSTDPEVCFDVSDVLEFQLRINDAVLDVGMDDEDTVNRIGKRLYNIYDKILYQRND